MLTKSMIVSIFNPSLDEKKAHNFIKTCSFVEENPKAHSSMPTRTRPIEKLAEAVAKCSAEVDSLILGEE
jgi:hypothetical protein